MIKNRVYKLKEDIELQHGIKFNKNQEISVVMDMVYMEGHPLPPQFQSLVYNFIINNPTKIEDITKNW